MWKDEFPSLEVLMKRTEADPALAWLNSALLFSSSPFQAVLIPLNPVCKLTVILVFLAWISLDREKLEEFLLLCFWSLSWECMQTSGSGWAEAWVKHKSAHWRPHPTCPGVQSSPKGSHSIQNKVNEFIAGLVLSWNLKPRLLGIIFVIQAVIGFFSL